MSRLLLLTLLVFALPDATRVLGKVHRLYRSMEYVSLTRIALKDSVSMDADDVGGGHEFGDGLRRRFKRAATDNDRLLVNVSILPDEGHNEAIVHWSGRTSLVRAQRIIHL